MKSVPGVTVREGCEDDRRGRVAYFFEPEIGTFEFELGHTMKPFRVFMTDRILSSEGLFDSMRCFTYARAEASELMRFHSPDYVNFLRSGEVSRRDGRGPRRVCPEGDRFGIGSDCPFFEGVFEWGQISAGGSMAAARALNTHRFDAAVNWAGGLHHAKRGNAAGFCYVADCVLGVLELLREYERVLYLDIDIHHGDGVEEAFYTTDRVLTVSFHQGFGFFPDSGAVIDRGIGRGEGFSVNVPLDWGVTDEVFVPLFKKILEEVLSWYRPGAILMQCGGDGLVGDQLGVWNMTTRGHGACVEFVRKLGIPMMVVGGGGYTVASVVRAWTNETAIIAGVEIPDVLPSTEYDAYFGPEAQLHIEADSQENMNSQEYLAETYRAVYEGIRRAPPPPSGPLVWNQDGLLFQPSNVLGS
jgi:histone deacetylase 1/2